MSGETHADSRARWITDAAAPNFVIQLVFSTIGAILAAAIAVSLGALITATITHNASGGNFIDHIGEQRIFVVLNQPYFLAPIIAGFLFGTLSHRIFRSDVARWVWVVPLAGLIAGMATWKTGGFRPYWRDVWDNYFGRDCGSSECAYEWLITLPFYTSVAYALGSIKPLKLWRSDPN